MLKSDYFRASLDNACYLHKDWCLEAFSVVADLSEGRKVDHPLALYRDDKDGRLYCYNGSGSERLYIDDYVVGHPLFEFLEGIELTNRELKNITGKVYTSYGNAVVNAILLVYPFGSKIPYMQSLLKVSKLEAEVQKRMSDSPDESKGEITVDEYLKFAQAAVALVGFTQLCVPSATAKTMTADPRMAEIRDRLVAEGAALGKLNDPVYIAKIDKALEEVDREWMKGDPGEGFYLKDKMFTIVRKRLYGMLGAEDPFGDGTHVQLMEQSLNDGWDISKSPVMFSNLREGSFNRGHQTELGGAVTKEINRYVTSSISEEDCGTKLGLPAFIKESNKRNYLNNYAFVDGKEVLLSEENIGSVVGKVIDVRSPIYCKTLGQDYCVHCCGKDLALAPQALGSFVSDIGSHFMSIFMASMHGTQLALATWDHEEHIV